jgi:hypothetical protein
MEGLGLSKKQVFRLIKYFEEKEIIKRIPSSRTVVEFVNPILEKHFKEKIKLTNNLASFEENGINSDDWKKIPVHSETYEELKKIKERKGITWDDLMRSLLHGT